MRGRAARSENKRRPAFPSNHPLPARVFDVLVATPPPRSLGAHPLPPDTHNGDRIEVEGEGAFVVRGVVLNYRLVGGRYVKAGATLEVASQGRFLVEKFLEGLVQGS